MKKIPKGRRLYETWSRAQFSKYRQCVAFIESSDANGDLGIGTCFHVGEGVFVTARHVVEHRQIKQIGFTDDGLNNQLVAARFEERVRTKGLDQALHLPGSEEATGLVSIISGPHFHPDPRVDVACFRVDRFPDCAIPLGGHLDDYLGQYELVLHRTLVMGYPRVPFTREPVLIASVGEINALIGMYGTHTHPNFVVSTTARGGFSGGPALVAYNEDNVAGGTAALGLVTESLVANDQAPELGYMAVLTVEPIYACLEHHRLLPESQRIDLSPE